jgi:hypothetical protein
MFANPKIQWFSTWGTRTPRGTWVVCRGFATFRIIPSWSFIYTRLETNGGTGVRKVLQSCLGVTQKNNIMIWGYVSTKSLRTPGLDIPSEKQSADTVYSIVKCMGCGISTRICTNRYKTNLFDFFSERNPQTESLRIRLANPGLRACSAGFLRIRDLWSRYELYLFKSGFVILDSIRIHIFTNFLYDSRNLKMYM